MVSPSETRYCLPPVAITAYISELLERRSLPLARVVSTLFHRRYDLGQHRAHDARELDPHAFFIGCGAQPNHPPAHIDRRIFSGDGYFQVDVGANGERLGGADEEPTRRDIGDQVALQVALRGVGDLQVDRDAGVLPLVVVFAHGLPWASPLLSK